VPGKEKKEAMQQVKVSMTIYSNTKVEQIKLFMNMVAKMVPLLLTPKQKHVGREGGSMQGKHPHKEEAYWTIEREA